VTGKRTVECQDCGYRWDSSASDPRCSKSECGRSRNVEPVKDDSTEIGDDGEPVEDDSTEIEDDESDTDDGFKAAFESVNQRADVDPTADTSPPTRTSDDDEDSDDSDDDASDGPDPAEDVPEIDPEQLTVAFDVTFDFAADRRGEHWKLDDGEGQKLGKAWAPVLNTYAPRLFAEHTEVGIAVMATFAVVAPKLAEDRELQKLREQQQRAEQDGEPGEVREPTDGSTEAEATDTPEWPDEQGDGANRDAATAGGYDNV
jgi:hypothetical protein